MKYVELKKHIAAGALSPAYTLYGNDRYLLSYAKKLFTDGVGLPELNVNTFAGDARPGDVVRACTVMPLMSKYRVVYYYGFKTVDRAIVSYLENPSPDTVLLLEPAVYNDKDAALAATTPVDCSHLTEDVLLAWIARASGQRFSADAAKLLIAYTLGDLARIETEVKKLCAYTDGLVEAELVRSMVTRDAEHKIYELSQEVFSGDPDKAYDIMASLLRELDPLAILKTLYGEAHKLLYVAISRDADSEIAASFKVKPYALKYLRQRAKLFSPVRLKEIVDYIATCDYRIKSGSMTSDVAVYNVVARILSLRNKGRV